MEKKLSIEKIKKEIIDRMINNVEVLKYLNTDKFIGKDGELSDIYNALIFDYDSGNNSDDYITIEVSEHKHLIMSANDGNNYTVSIKIGLLHKNNLDKLAAVIKEIVRNLYPSGRKYRNIPFYTKLWNGRNDLNRLITFEIEE